MSSPSGSHSSEDGRYSSTQGHPGSTGGQGSMTVPDFLIGGQVARRQSAPGMVEALPDAAAGRLRDAQRMDAWFQRVLKKGESKGGSAGPASPVAIQPRSIGGGVVLPAVQADAHSAAPRDNTGSSVTFN